MNKKNIKALILAGLSGASAAQATELTFDLDYYIGSGFGATGATVTVSEAATTGDVHFDISNWAQGSLNEIFFNYAPNGDIAGGVVNNFSATNGVVGTPSVQYNGNQGFALVFDFPNKPGPNFTFGESVSFDLSANADLAVSGFNNLGGGPLGDDYFVVAHINGAAGEGRIGDINGGVFARDQNEFPTALDAIVSIPVPATAWLLALGLLGIFGLPSKSARVNRLTAC